MRKIILTSVFFIIVLLLGSVFLSQLNNNNQNNPELIREFVNYRYNVDINVIINQTKYYKGQNIPFNLLVNISGWRVHIKYILFFVKSGISIAGQKININKTLDPGNHLLSYTIFPSFTYKGFIALNYGNYIMENFSVSCEVFENKFNISNKIDHPFEIIPYPIVDQAKLFNWSIDTSHNIQSVIFNHSRIEIQTGGFNGSIIFHTRIYPLGYTNINYQYTNMLNSSIDAYVSYNKDNNTIKINGINNSIPIGVLNNNNYNYTLFMKVNINNTETVLINLKMQTQKNVIFVVSANNNWTGRSTDGFTFQKPWYYIHQASSRYEKTFNISFLEVLEFHFSSNTTSNLFELINDARISVGDALFSSGWDALPGTSKANRGADILLIFTNKTMDHLGVVIGEDNKAFNMAVSARGSLFQGNYRLPSNFADNLLQHEMSHIFGAPDRWTYSDPPSIMTKSMPDDAFLDIAFGRFWLMRTNWLEIDIQTMIHESLNFL